MRYSLLSRFRGALLGSLVGEILGSSSTRASQGMLTLPKSKDKEANPILLDWSKIAACGTESLIRCGRLDLEDWVLCSSMTQPSLLLLKESASSSEAATAMLPIALFFHDDEVKLQQQLLASAAVWQQDTETSEGVLAVGYAIALALTEKLDIATLIPRTLTYLGTSETPLVKQLEQVQRLLEQGAGLETTLTQLRRNFQPSCSYTSIALAFYCFLNTPEDFRLCVSRAVRTNHQVQLTSTLTGILAGVYNSMIGIPISWRLAANLVNPGIGPLQLADRLFAVWSGIYDVSAVEHRRHLAVAAPRVIQPR